MNPDVAAWLDSPEGQEWSLPAAGPAAHTLLPVTLTRYPQLAPLGPLRAAYDPCGAPPLGEREA